MSQRLRFQNSYETTHSTRSTRHKQASLPSWGTRLAPQGWTSCDPLVHLNITSSLRFSLLYSIRSAGKMSLPIGAAEPPRKSTRPSGVKARVANGQTDADSLVVSRAAQISPYAPCPITLVSSYRFGATNVRPERSYVRDVSDTSGAGRGGDGMVAAAAASAVCCSRTWRSRSFAA